VGIAHQAVRARSLLQGALDLLASFTVWKAFMANWPAHSWREYLGIVLLVGLVATALPVGAQVAATPARKTHKHKHKTPVPECSDEDLSTRGNNMVAEKSRQYCKQRKLEKELERTYQAALVAVEDTDPRIMDATTRESWKRELRQAQEDWRTFVKRDCGLVEYEWWKGHGAGIAESECWVGYIAQRINELRERYQLQAEGGTH
jgi:uncharacterized protein YecT (DUF1311 family)